jgi:carbon monoxide dehydrogenase subunit G
MVREGSPASVESETPGPAASPKRSEAEALGGDATVEIPAPAYAVMDVLCRPEAIWQVLPNVANVEDLGVDGEDLLWRVTHALGVFRGGYVLRIRRDWGEQGSHTVRFWVDTRFERDVEDAWGYFRLEAVEGNRTRLHYRVRAVLFPGVIRWLFKEKIQWALMVVPERTQAFIERHREVPSAP